MVTLRSVCAIRACNNQAEFFMRWVHRYSGTVDSGLVCDYHDRLYGDRNLREAAKGRV